MNRAEIIKYAIKWTISALLVLMSCHIAFNNSEIGLVIICTIGLGKLR